MLRSSSSTNNSTSVSTYTEYIRTHAGIKYIPRIQTYIQLQDKHQHQHQSDMLNMTRDHIIYQPDMKKTNVFKEPTQCIHRVIQEAIALGAGKKNNMCHVHRTPTTHHSNSDEFRWYMLVVGALRCVALQCRLFYL